MLNGGDVTEATPGSLIMRGASLAAVIRWAYVVDEYQISGPSWLNSTRFDIAAKAGGPATVDELRVMLQALLADRFKLALHRESRELSGYVLSVAKGGIKFKPAAKDEPGMVKQSGMGSFSGTNVEVGQLVRVLAQGLRAPVADQTGLKGRYDFTINIMEYASEIMANRKPGDAPPDPAQIAAMVLNEQFGLKLEARKAPMEVLVIDRVEKTPTEN